MTRSTSGAGRGTDGTAATTTEAPPAPEPRTSAASVRRAIVRVLEEGQKTPDQVEKEAAVVLGRAARPSIQAQLRVLTDGDYVAAAKGDARKVQLTDTGRRWLRGIRALSAGRAAPESQEH